MRSVVNSRGLAKRWSVYWGACWAAGAMLVAPGALAAEPPAERGSIFDFGNGARKPAEKAATQPDARATQGATQPAHPAARTAPPVEAHGSSQKVVQVLRLLDPETARVSQYEFRDGVIYLKDPGATKITLPYAPAAEYDLAVDFVRTSGKSDVCVTFPVGRSNCTFCVGGGSSHKAFLGEHNGRWGSVDNPTFVDCALENDHLYHEVIKVRRDGVQAYLDGSLVCQCKTDGHHFTAAKLYNVRSAQLLGLGRYQSDVEFRSVEVTNLTGEGAVATEKAEDGRPLGPRAVGPDARGFYNLTPFDGSAHGWNLNFQRSLHKINGVDKNPDGLRAFGGWGSAEGYISWIVDVKQAGDYLVNLNYSCPATEAGSEVAVSFDGEAPLPFTVEGTGGWHEVRAVELGSVTLPAGRVTIALKCTKQIHSFVMDTEGLTLMPKK